MNKLLKRILIVVASIIIILIIGYRGLIMYTKSFSPEQRATFTEGPLRIEVDYSSPGKKDREIFGALVPFGQVWRTGANEATTFTTSADLTIDGKTLPAGSYTLFTIPGPESWEVIFNSQTYDWGINYDGTSPHNPDADILRAAAMVTGTNSTKENFSIYINKEEGLVFEWDRTRASMPFE